MAGGFTVWLTGLSGAGKTTIAARLEQQLRLRGRAVEVLDGDVVRTHLSKGLGFSREDRDTNILRIAFVSRLLAQHGVAVISAAISPYVSTRLQARAQIGDFVEVYVCCPLEELVRRDVKGLYARALRGEVANFTGVSDPYEAPEHPEVVVETDRESVEESVAKILAHLHDRGYIETPNLPVGPAGPAAAGGVDATPGGAPLPAPRGPAVVVKPAGRSAQNGSLAGIAAHGGRLVQRLVSGEAAEELRQRAQHLASVTLSARQLSDLELLGNGAFSPLEGFMGPNDYRRVVADLHLAGGLPWSLPVTLAVHSADAPAAGAPVALLDGQGRLRGILEVEAAYRYDKGLEAREVYRTEDRAHPGVAALYAQADTLLGGPVQVLAVPEDAGPYNLPPSATRAAFAARGWRTIVGFQTRNPVHRAHEYIQKCAMEIVDGMLLNPLVGETKSDDIPAEVRMRCYEVLLAGYYPADRVLLGVLPAAMRYAGPREAIFHALVRKNYGCTHFIVGRDHAGVGSYYGTYDAQRLFDQFTSGELGITPLKFDNTFYCRRCEGMASAKTCPHGIEHHLALSGTAVRALLRAGELPPPEYTRPEVAAVLLEAMRAETRDQA